MYRMLICLCCALLLGCSSTSSRQPARPMSEDDIKLCVQMARANPDRADEAALCYDLKTRIQMARAAAQKADEARQSNELNLCGLPETKPKVAVMPISGPNLQPGQEKLICDGGEDDNGKLYTPFDARIFEVGRPVGRFVFHGITLIHYKKSLHGLSSGEMNIVCPMKPGCANTCAEECVDKEHCCDLQWIGKVAEPPVDPNTLKAWGAGLLEAIKLNKQK
ncbi:MAG: hypothetical protein WC641_02940 [Patescibacteria group bacterium]